MYDSPERVQCAGDGKPSPRQGFLFDRRKVDAAQHLHYLWLVLTADQLESHANDRHPVFPDAVAFNAHLSNWRTPDGGVQRAAFYVMNYMRSHGAPFIPELRHRPMNDFGPFFEYIPAAAFNSAMKRSEVINGQHKLDGGHLCPSPLTSEQEGTFAGLYEAFLASTRAFNRAALEADQTFINGQSMCFHLTGLDEARLADGVGFSVFVSHRIVERRTARGVRRCPLHGDEQTRRADRWCPHQGCSAAGSSARRPGDPADAYRDGLGGRPGLVRIVSPRNGSGVTDVGRRREGRVPDVDLLRRRRSEMASRSRLCIL